MLTVYQRVQKMPGWSGERVKMSIKIIENFIPYPAGAVRLFVIIIQP